MVNLEPSYSPFHRPYRQFFSCTVIIVMLKYNTVFGEMGRAVPKFMSKEVFEKMPHKITDECIMCGSCEAECPESAISEGDPKYNIDPAKCSDCGTCAETCPSEAIVSE